MVLYRPQGFNAQPIQTPNPNPWGLYRSLINGHPHALNGHPCGDEGKMGGAWGKPQPRYPYRALENTR